MLGPVKLPFLPAVTLIVRCKHRLRAKSLSSLSHILMVWNLECVVKCKGHIQVTEYAFLYASSFFCFFWYWAERWVLKNKLSGTCKVGTDTAFVMNIDTRSTPAVLIFVRGSTHCVGSINSCHGMLPISKRFGWQHLNWVPWHNRKWNTLRGTTIAASAVASFVPGKIDWHGKLSTVGVPHKEDRKGCASQEIQ